MKHDPANVKIVLGETDRGPLALPLSMTREKQWAVFGSVGQRKSLFLASLLLQFLRLPQDVVVMIDLGGDQAVFWLLREAAQAAGKPFYFLSLDETHDSCSWDPIHGCPAYRDDPMLASAGVAQGLSLIHGEGPRKYWSRQNQSTVDEAFDNLRLAGLKLPSFAELAGELKRMGKDSGSAQYVSEAYLAAEPLLRFSALTKRHAVQLDLARAFEEGAVVYGYLPTARRSEASRAVASLLAYSVMVQAAHRTNLGLEPRYGHLGVEEYAQICAPKTNLDASLTLARKWGLHHYFVLQDASQLKTQDGDLGPIIRSQCQRVIFSCESEDEIDELRNRSLDVPQPHLSTSLRGLGASTSLREELEPGLTRNEIMQRSGVALDAYAVLKLGDKHRDPIPFRVIPPTASPEEHAKLKNRPLPQKPRRSAPCSAGDVGADDAHGAAADFRAALLDLEARIAAESAWELPKNA
ncbi:MAG: hypothetical protein CMJ58_00380 [Planctomycetaceae bacterium]|nr:hypothetical protein [Planctomycetaceae bacterium]